MRAISAAFSLLVFQYCLGTTAVRAETNVLDGRIFQGTSDYTADTNDDLIRNVVRKVDAVVLGRLEGPDDTVKWNSRPNYFVTVLEPYKGSLKPGDRICVHMEGDGETPDVRDMVGIGKKGYFFINRETKDAPGTTGFYGCDPIDIAPYARYGEPMGKLLRTIAQREIVWLDTLLAPSGEREVANPEEGAAPVRWRRYLEQARGAKAGASPEENVTLPRVGWYWSGRSLFHMRWVSRGELLARKGFWEQCVANHTIPSTGVPCGEMDEGFSFSDTSVCEYTQSLPESRRGSGNDPIPAGGKPFSQGDYAAPFEEPVWVRWEPPEKARLVYRAFADLPNEAQGKPDDTSWCVMMEYLDNGKSYLRHFYVSSRLEIQALLYHANELGEDCSKWDRDDKRLTTVPGWMAEDLKYDPKIWPKE